MRKGPESQYKCSTNKAQHRLTLLIQSTLIALLQTATLDILLCHYSTQYAILKTVGFSSLSGSAWCT